MNTQTKTPQPLNYINSLMREINSYTDNIYECLMDGDNQELCKNADKLMKTLGDIKRTHKYDKI